MYNSDLFERNHTYIQSVNPGLAAKLIERLPLVLIEDIQGEGVMLTVDGQCWTQNLVEIAQAQWTAQSLQPDRVMMARIVNDQPPKQLITFLPEVFDSEQLVTLSNLPSLSTTVACPADQRLYCRDILLLGAFALLYVPILLKSNQILSFVLVEPDLAQFTAALHFIDFAELIQELKLRQIGFNFIHEESSDLLQASLLSFYGSKNPLALHGLRILRSFWQSPLLIELYSWLHAQDGLAEHCKGFLGNDTDEMNQTIHALWNTLLYRDARRLAADVLDDSNPLVIVASGPSLDEQLSWLQDHHTNLTIISAGSSLGTLVRSGIHVDAAVFLEMGTIVFRDISDLLLEGYDLSGINLFASITIDPRIASEFKDVIFFHRPHSAAFALFPDEVSSLLPQAGPQAANAALEVALQLGSRNLLLLGCDFAAADLTHPRSELAIGSSERSFDLPVPGRLGSTVFSSSELSVTRQLFENALLLYGANATSIGNGAMMKGVTAVKRAEDLDSLHQFFSSPNTFSPAIERLPKRTNKKADLAEVILSASQDLCEVCLSLRKSVASSECWSFDLSTKLGSYISWSDEGLLPAQRLRQRLTRFLFFFIFQPLHDEPADDPSRWHEALSHTLKSIDLTERLFVAFFAFLLEIDQAQKLPLFDPQWIKQRLSASAQKVVS